MKSQVVTQGIVLARTDFQEADRILTMLTPDHGKVRLIAKGVRRPKSKLAGGIELFSVNDITYLPSRSEIKTLISSRLLVNYSEIVKDIQRTMLGYDILKRLNRLMEDAAEPVYFELLQKTLAGLNDHDLDMSLLELWFTSQLGYISGHMPNLKTDTEGNRLEVTETYLFDFDNMAFRQQKEGAYNATHIKLMRLMYGADNPLTLKQVTDASQYAADMLALAKNIQLQNN
jgi:DNA repair protein RecO (recombination protein O)